MKILAVAACLAASWVAMPATVTLAADSAASGGQVSGDLLAGLGLGEMQSVNDEQGLQIRGKGRLIVQVNVLIVRTPSINIQQNAIGGSNRIIVKGRIGGGGGGMGGGGGGG